jgi:hypothetical protein
MYALLFTSTHVARPVHLIFHKFIAVTTSAEQHQSRRPSQVSPDAAQTQAPSSAPLSICVSLCSAHNATDQVLNPYKTTGTIAVFITNCLSYLTFSRRYEWHYFLGYDTVSSGRQGQQDNYVCPSLKLENIYNSGFNVGYAKTS